MSPIKDKFEEIIKDYPQFIVKRGAFLAAGNKPLDEQIRNLLSFDLRKLDEIPPGKDDFQEYLEFHRKISSFGQSINSNHQPQSENLADLINETRKPFAFVQYQINADK